ncbi:MAG TPA: hypothetical protein VK158_00090 [Acidobacteriota bacterium]|nr:hypothetical protein [Acidobacteriota bacterium]
MKYKATFSVSDASKEIHTMLVAEVNSALNTERGTISLTHQRGTTIVTVDAQDATALRAITNGVCKILSVHEKMESL